MGSFHIACLDFVPTNFEPDAMWIPTTRIYMDLTSSANRYTPKLDQKITHINCRISFYITCVSEKAERIIP